MHQGSEDDAGGQGPPRPASPRQGADVAAVVLVVVALGLVALSVLTRYLAYRREMASPGIAPPAWMALFDVNSEANVPTWFAVALLVTAGVVAVVAGVSYRCSAPQRGRFHLVLAGVLLLLSLDELAGLHERLGSVGTALTGGGGVHFAWVVPGALVAGAVVVGLGVGGRTLDPATRRRLLVAVAVYFAGALGAETVSGQVLIAQGDRAAYLLVTGLEEFLEMLGVVLLLRALLKELHIEATATGWLLRPAGSSAP